MKRPAAPSVRRQTFWPALLLTFLVCTCAPGIATAAPPSTGAGLDDFLRRCRSVAVVVCLPLDSESEIAKFRVSRPKLAQDDQIRSDPAMHAARFTIPSHSGADTSGHLQIPFPEPLVDVYVSFDIYYPNAFLKYPFRGGGGWKMFILGQGNEGCAPYEIVGNDLYYRGFPNFYYMCGVFHSVDVQNPLGDSSDQFDMQPGGDTQCLRNGPPRNLPCARFVADEWVTYQIHVDSRRRLLEVWQTTSGKTLKIIDFTMTGFPTTAPAYEWIMLTPYNTGKDATEEHPRFSIWYRRVIVSTQRIPMPPPR